MIDTPRPAIATRQITRDATTRTLIVPATATAQDSAASMIALRAGALGIVANPSGASGPAGIEAAANATAVAARSR